MKREFSAIIKKDGDWWIGWVEEVSGVNCQERTEKQLLLSLESILKEALEFNRKDSRLNAGSDYTEVKIAV